MYILNKINHLFIEAIFHEYFLNNYFFIILSLNMPKLLFLFLFLALFLNCITEIQAKLYVEQKEAIEIKIDSWNEFGRDKNYFKFNYYGSNEAKIIFNFEPGHKSELYLIDPENEKYYLGTIDNRLMGNLTYNGTYYLELICQSIRCEFGGKFYSTIIGNTETIDFSDNVYYQDIDYSNEYYLGLKKFKVSNLKEEKLVYFSIYFLEKYGTKYSYPFYPGEGPPYSDSHEIGNLTIFEIFNVNNQKSERNIRLYKFEPNQEYIIYIHCLKKYYDYDNKYYYYARYLFFQLTNSHIKTFTGEENIIFPEGPMFGIVNSNIQKDFYIKSYMNINYVKTKETFENNLQILSSLEFSYSYDIYENVVEFKKEEDNNIIILFIPKNFENKAIYFVDEFFYATKFTTFTIPANKSMVIFQESEDLYDYNYVFTYKSDFKNMRFFESYKNEDTDYIIQYYGWARIFIGKTERDCTITVTQYNPKFAHLLAKNSYTISSLYSNEINYFIYGINKNNYLKLVQMNIRISPTSLSISEFYNAYYNQLNTKINFFIRQLYGGSELYECDASGYDIYDLQFLTTPISNVKCKNKKSIFNRLYSFDGTKIISGYLAPNSYFDIYFEINNDTKKEIDISLLMEYELKTRNTAKYLKKGVEYKINFYLNHLIKLDPEFDAEIKLTKGQNIKTINTNNPYLEISGEGYTIKSNIDALIYFIGKLPSEVFQKEIDLEKSKGKIIKISNIFERDKNFTIDLGFKNYCPLKFHMDHMDILAYPYDEPLDFKIRDNGVLYLDNIYEKLKVKLIENEKLFIYSTSEQINKLKIEYIGYNLNNKNNDFNIFLINKNNEENTIIINTNQKDPIMTDIYFCEPDTTLRLTFLGKDNETEITITNDDSYNRTFNLFQGDNKIIFETNKPVIFTYLFFDLFDKNVFQPDRNGYWNDRRVFNKLTIEEIVDKNNDDDIIKIKFNPNYKLSTTRYIILIAQKNEENNLDNFKDPCYLAGLLNQRPKGIKIEVIYDAGDNDTVNAEVDLNDILSDKNEYIVNIISQELRFEKKIHFYEPKEFSHVAKNPEYEEDDDNINSKGIRFVLLLVLPIFVGLIISLIIIFVTEKRKNPLKEIEKISGIIDKSND